MRALKFWLFGLRFALFGVLFASSGAVALSGNTVATENVKARLVSEVGAIGPGQTFWVALELEIRDGWHTYWRNPGDSGEPTKLAWQLPPGFTAGDIVWTTPHRFEIAPLVNYGYAKHAVHLVQITAPKDLKAGTPVSLAAKASWLVCSDVCIPEDANLQVTLPVGAQAGAIDAAAAALFTTARSELPSPQPAPTSARIQGDQLIVTLGREWGATLSQITSLAFFPYDEGGIEYATPQTLTRGKDSVDLAMKVGYQPPKAGAIRGVLVVTEKNGAQTDTVPIEIAADFSGAGAAGVKAGPRFAPLAQSNKEPEHSLPTLLLFAVLGGLILNLMPCVFPVLSIKALNVMEQAKNHPAEVRAKGLVFAAGVIVSMLCLAGVLLVLRAGGEQLGWGFQLQSPLFVTLLVYLLLAVGLNLSGVFEVGGGLAGVGDNLTQGDSYSASFFTGVLATLVATPCSAPFMAPAVGAALTQSPFNALCIFAALGVGIALPYVLLSFAPWMRSVLPKPGAWMDTLKQVFAFPVYATAAWLLWVVAQETSPFGLGAALAGSILVALAAWSFQKSRSSAGGGRITVIATAVISLLLAIFLPIRFADVAAAAPGDSAQAARPGVDEWQPYSEARVAELNAAGRPLLVNFTASWCLTCLVNERNAFTDPAVQAIFKDKKVVLMKGDWTNRDPAITKALAAFGRAGVPLYLVYNGRPGSTEPVVLPQLLTAGVVQNAFADTPAK
ncbi:MAG TPA: thioredoxin family protein [Steroidobacteraceae bacterium]|jgi:thiol:disulfide interchange protein DsbD|nr:thioredoxin family protein [Steroidobacteraceae bacterium]